MPAAVPEPIPAPQPVPAAGGVIGWTSAIAAFGPFIFGVMFFFFPAGLVLYWVVNNVLSIAQQWQITRMIESGGKAANDAKA